MLRPDIVLPFDDPELAGCTVGDVLADPERFEGETLADPLEGVGYGRCGAKIMRRADGTPWIHSFAHGRTIYELKHDAAAVREAMEKAAKEDGGGDLRSARCRRRPRRVELEALRQLAKTRSGVGAARDQRRAQGGAAATGRAQRQGGASASAPLAGRIRGRRSGRRSATSRGCRRWRC